MMKSRQIRTFTLLLIACAAGPMVCGSTAWGQIGTFSSNFSGNVPGNQPSDSSLNGLGDFTTFGAVNVPIDLLGGTSNLGQVLFFNRGEYYESGPRAYGVVGTGRSDIVFTAGVIVSEVVLDVRGTDSADTSGGGSVSIPGSTPFDDGVGTVLIYTDLGLQVTINDINNIAFQEIALSLGSTIGGQTLNGDSIRRISLINQGDANSAIVLGRLTATTIPEPASLALLSLGGVALFMGRRSRRRA